MLKKVVIHLLLLLAFISCAATESAFAAGPVIRVGLAANQINVIVSAKSDFKLVDAVNGTNLGEYKADAKVALSMKKGTITLNGKSVDARKIAVVSATDKDLKAIEVNRRLYRGLVAIHPTNGKNGLTAVNTLSLEEYLYGVLPREISPAWPVQALRSQAVAARTYALYNLNKYQADGYDVNASTDCQVYGGINCEDSRTTDAVNDTTGQVIEYQGKLIAAYFHSNGGSYTENSENVWGGYEPYLRAVADYDQDSPHYRWQKEIKPQDLEDSLRAAGYNIGSLQAIELSTLVKPPMSVADRGVSGRVKEVRFIGSKGNVLLNGTKLRTILELNSTLFDIRIVLPTDKYFDVDIVDVFGQIGTKRVDMNLPPFLERKLPTDKPEIRRLSGRTDEKVLFIGYGWGHGLGLSQWGSKAMAEKAPAGDAEYFKTILKHYYQGVDIQKIY